MRHAVLKRVKFTKTGKLLHRHGGQNHFNAKESRRVQKRRGRFKKFSRTMEKKIKQYYG